MLTTTGSFGFDGVDNGLLISFVTACKVCAVSHVAWFHDVALSGGELIAADAHLQALLLMGILPIVIRLGRKKYVRWLADRSSVHPTMEGLSESSRLLDNPSDSDLNHGTQDDATETVAGTERFDVYFGGLSFVVDAIAFTAIGLSKSKVQLYLCTQTYSGSLTAVLC